MVWRVDCNSDLIARMHAEVSRGGLLPSVAVAILANTVLKDEESARNNYVLACDFAKYSPIKKVTERLSNKPFLIWLLTTPPHLKCAVTLSCILSLIASFADINVSQGNAATYAGCGGIFNIRLTTILSMNLPVKIFLIG